MASTLETSFIELVSHCYHCCCQPLVPFKLALHKCLAISHLKELATKLSFMTMLPLSGCSLNSTKLKAVKESIAGIAGPQAGMVHRHGNASNFQSNSEIMHKQVHVLPMSKINCQVPIQ